MEMINFFYFERLRERETQYVKCDEDCSEVSRAVGESKRSEACQVASSLKPQNNSLAEGQFINNKNI